MRRNCATKGYNVSVVVRARNVRYDLEVLLGILRRQALPLDKQLEVIVVDNESTDGTGALARANGADVVELSSRDFSWGRAINLGVERARGELVVLLSADAWPVGSDWLVKLCAPFTDELVGVVYGRQIPKADAPLDEWVRVRQTFPEAFRKWTGDDIKEGSIRGLVASNACAVLRRAAWERVRYDEKSHGAEEPPWTTKILQAGYCAVYCSEAVVEHSHREPANQQALRLWEFELEKQRSRHDRLTIGGSIRVIGAFVKRRLQNLFVSGAGARRRCVAILTLPWEASVLAAIGVATLAGWDFARLRQRWWRGQRAVK